MLISIEDAINCVDTLNNIKETVDKNIEEGKGLPQDASELVKNSIDMVFKLVNDKDEVVKYPSTENFTNKKTRLAGTILVSDILDNSIKKVEKKIKDNQPS